MTSLVSLGLSIAEIARFKIEWIGHMLLLGAVVIKEYKSITNGNFTFYTLHVNVINEFFSCIIYFQIPPSPVTKNCMIDVSMINSNGVVKNVECEYTGRMLTRTRSLEYIENIRLRSYRRQHFIQNKGYG